MRPLPLETERVDETDRRQTRPDAEEGRPSSDEDEIWLDVQEF